MTASPMAADIAASDPEELVEVAFPAILDHETGEPMMFGVKEFRPGQVIMIYNKAKMRNASTEQSAKNMGLIAQMIVSLVADEGDRDYIEQQMAIGEVDLDDLLDFLDSITEALAGRPTKPSSASSPTRTTSGRSSQARSVRRASPSKNSG